MPQLSYPLDLIEWSGDKKFGVKNPLTMNQVGQLIGS